MDPANISYEEWIKIFRENAEESFEKNGRMLNKNILLILKILEIKKILQELKKRGIPNIYLSQNKVGLLDALKNIMINILSSETSASSLGANKPVAIPLSIPIPSKFNTTPIFSSKPINSHKCVDKPNFNNSRSLTNVIQSASNNSEHSSTTNNRINEGLKSQDQLSTHCPNSNLVQSSSSASKNSIQYGFQVQVDRYSLDKNEILNNSLKNQIYNTLMIIGGITEKEILEELKNSIPGVHIDADSILMKIVCKREEKVKLLQPLTKEQEDAAMDMAILESEKEREVIQQRKRQKITDLKSNYLNELIPEFQKSFLLWGSSKIQLDSTKLKIFDGCFIIRILVLYFDFIAISFGSSASLKEKLAPDESILMLRTSLVKLLLTEGNAVKFYDETTFPYLLKLSETLNSLYTANFEKLNRDILMSYKSGKDLDPIDYSLIESVLMTNSMIIENHFDKEQSKLELGFSKIPQDNCLVPTIFRKKSLLPYIEMMKNSLATDGFEFTDASQSLILVSEDEDEESQKNENNDKFDY